MFGKLQPKYIDVQKTFIILLFLSFTVFNFFSVGSSVSIERELMTNINERKSGIVIANECKSGGAPNLCCSYWTKEVSDETLLIGGVWPRVFKSFSCETGGKEKCPLGSCDVEKNEN